MFHPSWVLVLTVNCEFLLVTTSVQWLNLLCIRNILTADVHDLFYVSRQKVHEVVLRTETQNYTKWHTWMCEHKYFDNMLPRAVIAYSWFQPTSDGMAMACHISRRQFQNCGRLIECFVLYTGWFPAKIKLSTQLNTLMCSRNCLVYIGKSIC